MTPEGCWSAANTIPGMRISAQLYQEMVAHARQEAPNECCGMVALDDGTAVAVYRARSVEPSPYRFEIEPHDQIRIWNEIESNGLQTAVYHSHTRTEPKPSQTDINFAEDWPGIVWVIVGLAGTEPDMRAFTIDAGAVTEVELVVE